MRRTVSVAAIAAVIGAVVATPIAVYASHSFSDVPASNTFHADIEWLKASGVTRGCNPPANTEFCPDDFVTREQMSAFMRRLTQYLGAEDGTPARADNADQAADADLLDGFDSTRLAPRAAFNSTENGPDGVSFALPLQFTSPGQGILLMSGSANAEGSTLDTYRCFLRVDGELVGGSRVVSLITPGNESEDCTSTGGFVVDAGQHGIALAVDEVGPTTFFNGVSVWALWVPFDGTGAVPTQLSPTGDPVEVLDTDPEE